MRTREVNGRWPETAGMTRVYHTNEPHSPRESLNSAGLGGYVRSGHGILQQNTLRAVFAGLCVPGKRRLLKAAVLLLTMDLQVCSWRRKPEVIFELRVVGVVREEPWILCFRDMIFPPNIGATDCPKDCPKLAMWSGGQQNLLGVGARLLLSMKTSQPCSSMEPKQLVF